MRASREAVQIHGGYGYINEYPVERLFRDAKITKDDDVYDLLKPLNASTLKDVRKGQVEGLLKAVASIKNEKNR